MSRLLNVNLDKGTCVEERAVDLWSDDSVDAVITAIRTAAEGLERVTVEVQCDHYDGDEGPLQRLMVLGYRAMTADEIRRVRADREAIARRQAWNKAFPG